MVRSATAVSGRPNLWATIKDKEYLKAAWSPKRLAEYADQKIQHPKTAAVLKPQNDTETRTIPAYRPTGTAQSKAADVPAGKVEPLPSHYDARMQVINRLCTDINTDVKKWTDEDKIRLKSCLKSAQQLNKNAEKISTLARWTSFVPAIGAATNAWCARASYKAYKNTEELNEFLANKLAVNGKNPYAVGSMQEHASQRLSTSMVDVHVDGQYSAMAGITNLAASGIMAGGSATAALGNPFGALGILGGSAMMLGAYGLSNNVNQQQKRVVSDLNALCRQIHNNTDLKDIQFTPPKR